MDDPAPAQPEVEAYAAEVQRQVLRRLGRRSDLSRFDADDIASAILRGMDEGQHVILTDPEARAAVAAKTHARAEYDEQQFAFAERISGRHL